MVKKRSTSLVLTHTSKVTKKQILRLNEFNNMVLIKLKYFTSNPFFKSNYFTFKYLRFLDLYRLPLLALNLSKLGFVHTPIFKKHRFLKNSFKNSYYLDSNSLVKSSADYTQYNKSRYLSALITNSGYPNTLMTEEKIIYNSKLTLNTLVQMPNNKRAYIYPIYTNVIGFHKFLNFLSVIQYKKFN